MKKIVILCFLTVFTLTSCYTFSDPNKVSEMFNSFNHSGDCVILTHFQLVVGSNHYDRSEFKYNGKDTNILFLQEDGFYSYTYDKETLLIEFIFTEYNSFDVIELGEAILPADLHDIYYSDNCFWIRMLEASDGEASYMNFCWSILDGVGTITDTYHWYDGTPDYNRSEKYSFEYDSSFLKEELTVVDEETGIQKKIDSSILKSFAEGKKISEFESSTTFTARKAYVNDDDIYFVSWFGVDSLAENMYLYVIKWNFITEECTFITSIHFDSFQEWVDDFIILNK